MDRNQIFGIVLIAVILIAYSIYTKPSQEEIELAKYRADSVALVQQQRIIDDAIRSQEVENANQQITVDDESATISPFSIICPLITDGR